MPESLIPLLLAAITALPPTIAAMAALRQAKSASRLVERSLDQTAQIHRAVNSNLAAVQADLVIANQRIAELLAIIDRHDQSPERPA